MCALCRYCLKLKATKTKFNLNNSDSNSSNKTEKRKWQLQPMNWFKLNACDLYLPKNRAFVLAAAFNASLRSRSQNTFLYIHNLPFFVLKSLKSTHICSYTCVFSVSTIYYNSGKIGSFLYILWLFTFFRGIN